MGNVEYRSRTVPLMWAVELADSLGIDRFAIEGISSGGPYAIACTYRIPHRITACSIISGMGPFGGGLEDMKASNLVIFTIAQHLPWLVRLLLWG